VPIGTGRFEVYSSGFWKMEKGKPNIPGFSAKS